MMMYKLLALAILVAAGNANDCVPRNLGGDTIVCVCNATYCDETPEQGLPERGVFHYYTSSKAGKRLHFSQGNFNETNTSTARFRTISLTLNSSKTYQKIIGFGGAFTDAAGINIAKLSKATQDLLIKSYFAPGGSRYSLGRVPIGGTDFSERPYTLADIGPDNDTNFRLSSYDHEYKIPYIKRALELNPNLQLFGVAWSAPAWMKTNNNISGFGFLKKEYYQAYADYLLDFLKAYNREGISVWALSTGNEPNNAWFPFITFNKMGWTPKTVGQWVAKHLGPTLRKSEYNDTKIMAIDDQRVNLPWYAKSIFKNQVAKDFIHMIAVHYYLDRFVSPWRLDETCKLFNDKTLLMTEACLGTEPGDGAKVKLGDWGRGVTYVMDIMQNLDHCVAGWVDWNLALDAQGGPNWVGNYADSSIIINATEDTFYKQTMYYGLKHYTRFVPSGSVKIHLSKENSIDAIAFKTPNNEIVVVVMNRSGITKIVKITDEQWGTITLEVEPHSIVTTVYQN